MATLTMPQLGESVTEGTILRWIVAPGAPVALDDPLVEIETEKVTVEIPSPLRRHPHPGARPGGRDRPRRRPPRRDRRRWAPPSPAGQRTGPPPPRRQTPPQSPPRRPSAPPPRRLAQQPPGPRPPLPLPPRLRRHPHLPWLTPHRPPPPAPPVPAANAPRRYSPAVTRLATEHGIDPDAIGGSGARGRVTRKDVLAAVAARAAQPPGAQRAARPAPATIAGPSAPVAAGVEPPTAPGDEVVPLSPTRRRIAQHMLQSKRDAPHAWLLVECDATALVRRRAAEREAFQAREGIDLTYLPYVARAVCRALREFPDLNAIWDGDRLIRRGNINLGIAIDAPEGLIVPAVKDADRLTVPGLARAMAGLAERARSRRLTLDDVTGGSFTLDNTGVFGTTATAPIINTPQVAVLTTEAIIKRPVVVEGDAIAVRSMMNLCLSFDHRAMDGATAAHFTTRVRDILQTIDRDPTIG